MTTTWTYVVRLVDEGGDAVDFIGPFASSRAARRYAAQHETPSVSAYVEQVASPRAPVSCGHAEPNEHPACDQCWESLTLLDATER